MAEKERHMPLEEAILHCKEKANDLKNEAEHMPKDSSDYKPCLECASEHEQLARWLVELKDRREGVAVCENCEYETRAKMEWPCVSCKHKHTDKYIPKKKTVAGENDWYDIPAEEMTKEQAQKAVKELRKALLEARTEAKHG